MKRWLKILVLGGVLVAAALGFPSSVAAFPQICPTGYPSCSITGEACTKDAICCITGLGFFACDCVNGHYQCNS